MKLTDFAIIFVVILLPVVIIVYVNTAFVVKAEKQEMYYKNLMNSAVSDAVSAMKQVESDDSEIDYGYSGIIDKKVSVNAKIAISTFYNSLANNFNIAGNNVSLENLKMYIPVIAILDYDGIYIHSAEEDADKRIVYTTKPKVYYTYSYVIEKKQGLVYNQENEYNIVSLDELEDLNSINRLDDYIYEITYTMDDYVYLNIYEMAPGDTIDEDMISPVFSKSFYIDDSINNSELIYSKDITYSDKDKLLNDKIIPEIKNKRQMTIGTIAMREISYAVNRHNSYASSAGIKYTFNFSVESDSAWYETIDGIGVIAMVQGISLGNRYLNYKAYSASDLIAVKKYYVSNALELKDENGNLKDIGYLAHKLYHSSTECEAYKQYLNSSKEVLLPSYYMKKGEAASHGFYPCPICKP